MNKQIIRGIWNAVESPVVNNLKKAYKKVNEIFLWNLIRLIGKKITLFFLLNSHSNKYVISMPFSGMFGKTLEFPQY